MTKRVASTLMALAIALCPTVLDVCRVICAGHDTAPVATAAHQHHDHPSATGTPEHHAHHAPPQASADISPVAVGAGAHGCMHDAAMQAFVGPQLQLALAPATVGTLLELPPLASRPFARVEADPPDLSQRTALTAQLRI